MSRQEKITYIIIGGLILILFFLVGKKPVNVIEVTEENQPVEGPIYLNYNYPETNLPSFIPLPGGSPKIIEPEGCSGKPQCGCASQNMFSSNQKLVDSFNEKLGKLADVYIENVVGSLPNWFGQYLNNTTGAALSWSSQSTLQSV